MKTKNIRKQIQEALIQELGDTTDAYPYKESYKDVGSEHFLLEYIFETGKGTLYKVRISYKMPMSDEFIYVNFVANQSYDTVNEGTMFRSIATVIRIISDFWLHISETLSDAAQPFSYIHRIDGFEFSVVEKGVSPQDSARFKIYRAFIKKQFPSATVQVRRDVVSVVP